MTQTYFMQITLQTYFRIITFTIIEKLYFLLLNIKIGESFTLLFAVGGSGIKKRP